MLRGQAIKKAREAAGWTQQHLSDIMRVSRMTIYNWEQEIHQPSSRDQKYLEEVLLHDGSSK
jgi:transcriptional regulator with XRE-family HTH domain